MPDGGTLPNRVRAIWVSQETTLSVRKVQELAVAGKIPGAAKLSGVWTFDPICVRAWIAAEERNAWRRSLPTSISAATNIGAGSTSPDASIAQAYEQIVRRTLSASSKSGARR